MTAVCTHAVTMKPKVSVATTSRTEMSKNITRPLEKGHPRPGDEQEKGNGPPHGDEEQGNKDSRGDIRHKSRWSGEAG